MSERSDRIYRISFVNQDRIYEIFAKQVYESDLYGFVVVEEIVFGTQSSLVIDPGEERLKTEFEAVKRSFIPIHSVIRIDEVEKTGISKVHALDGNPASNISHFPRPAGNKKND
ncbi:DUF1820 family protein [Thiothrix unzii]|uniref:DUF1820 family protein n=2 Tax=Thiothrix TaxID=1030 RepID=A0A975FAH7_9GAMM|nr:DUF1820 family protein [Thiothrix unzii]MDX9987879.1 DUF1820 family protein [Thiothrix unzii]OQX09620.1 MAG: hypothetical protein BWK73_22325 [Thiothrix lacustris]QTR54400.1 DUF1820 family protein [Thiothrix unzii]